MDGTLELKTLKFVIEKHLNQTDDDGVPYCYHCMSVANMVKLLDPPDYVVAGAYLHDTLEDTNATYEQLLNEFGTDVAELVKELTHVKNKEKGSYFPHLHSHWAIAIKLCDQAHNISRMNSWDDKKKKSFIKKSRFWKISEDDPIRSCQ